MTSTHLNQFLGDCQDILGSLEETSQQLAYAIGQDIAQRRALKEAEDALAAAEADLVATAAIKAKIGEESPLSGLATTSKPYQAAIDAMIADARSNGLAPLWTRVQDLRHVVDDAQSTRESWATRYSALKHAADLRAAMLKAFTA